MTEAEQAELTELIAERCRLEEAAIEEATRRTEEENARLEEQLQRVQAQNRELETLIREQDAYLAEVNAMIAQMEERRRSWRERYVRLTGKPPGEPATPHERS